MNELDKDIGAKIRFFRKLKGFSLNQLSAATGIAASNLSVIELGKSSPTLATMVKLAKAFGMKVGTFLDDALYTRASLIAPPDSSKDNRPAAEFSLTRSIFLGKIDANLLQLSPGTEWIQPVSSDKLFYGLQGTAEIEIDGEVFQLQERYCLYVLPGPDCEIRNKEPGAAHLLIVSAAKIEMG